MVGTSIVRHPDVDMITFTGSREVGETIAASAGMIKTVFELGDNGALLVCEDADLSQAVKVVMSGAYATAGQSCRGIKRVFVSASIADEFVELLVEATSTLKVGNPLDPKTDVGTLIDEQAAQLVEGRVKEAVVDGAHLRYGGIREGALIYPAVLDHVCQNSQLVRKETFGPIAPVIRFRNFEEAIDSINSSPYGLQTGVLTSDLSRALYAARKLRVGAVNINFGPNFDALNIPFGGVKKSGLGREGAYYAIREMTTVKTVVLNMAETIRNHSTDGELS